MGLKTFIYIFFVVGLFFLFVSFEYASYKTTKSNQAPISFKDATLYSFDNEGLSSIFITKEAYEYDEHSEFKFAILTSKNKANANVVDSFYADDVIQKAGEIVCKKNVKFNRGTFLTLTTNQLRYNTKTKALAINDKFSGVYYAHTLSGNALFVDNNTKIFVEQPHFEIEVLN